MDVGVKFIYKLIEVRLIIYIHILILMMSIMKATLLLALMALISCNTEFGVRECIQKLSGSELFDICQTLDKDKFKSCFNGYYSLTLCLANNKCYEAQPNAEVYR